MIKVHLNSGETKTYDMNQTTPTEHKLVIAAFEDDFEKVKSIIQSNANNLDINAVVVHSPSRGNGTALILTGRKDIAQLLVQSGAVINKVYTVENLSITALDSALKEIEKDSTKNSSLKMLQAKELIKFLQDKGAKTFKELNNEN